MKKVKKPFSHAPRKRFGQHFLTDKNVILHIIQASGLAPGDQVVEIGPGRGALTHELLPMLGSLDVVELDRDLIPLLKASCLLLGDLRIFEADALNFDFRQLAASNRKMRIIGNLPYNISTPLLFHLLTYTDLIADMTFMLQKEVVDRICATPGDTHYGRLSVMIQYFCEAVHLFDVEPDAFTPPPAVQSSIVKLIPYPKLPYQAKNWDLFAEIVRISFNYRRKTLQNSVKSLIDSNAFELTSIDPQSRAQELSVADFVRLSNFISK